MKKSVLLIYLLLLTVFGIGISGVKAQTLTLSAFPQTICQGDQTIATASISGLPSGVTVDSVRYDFNNDGVVEGRAVGQNTPPTASADYTYTYPTYGAYTIRATALLTNGTTVSGTFNVTVIQPPVPDFDIVSFKTQCFRGNRIEVENKTITLGSKIVSIKYIWDDGESEEIFNPAQGLRTPHSYQFSDTFEITMIVRDSAGCSYTLPVADTAIIKQNLQPKFEALGSRGCFSTPYKLRNLTTGITFPQVKRYTWDFGDGTSDTRQVPWTLPIDEYNFDTITHWYTGPGSFYPALIIEDFTGCIDSVRLKPSDNVPENITFTFNIIPTINTKDTIPRGDSVCFGQPHGSAVFFYHEPVVFLNSGDFLWNFGDPDAPPPEQVNNRDWWAAHTYAGICEKTVSLTLFLSNAAPNCPDTTHTIKVRILGPQSKIEDPPNQITIDPSEKSQCVINKVVEFPNTSKYCFSDHIWRRWDFGDDVAPKCTSFLIPKPGFPPPGGWTYQSSPRLEQYNNSVGYFIQNGQTYVGKRLDCAYSYDTLPVHKYTDWDLVYQWYRDGHDFMPWDFTRYTRNPADTVGPNPKFWVADRDTSLWGKPVYLDPTTGDMKLVQGTYNDPVTGLTHPFPRIDTIGQNLPVKLPQDLEPFNRITVNRGTPDPFELEAGKYNIFPKGKVVDPKNQPGGFTYRVGGQNITYPYSKKLSGQDADMTLYKYIFFREVQRCITVTLAQADSFNNGSDYRPAPTFTDFLLLDSADCNQEATVQLALVRPDARGLGKNGRECPGKFTPDKNGIKFHLDPTIYTNEFTGETFDYPGINPTCGQTFILLNHDSLADRLDATPCALDGFVDWQGGTTAGGLFRPIFSNVPDWSNPMQFWQNPKGTSTWYHYGPGTVFGGNVLAPADPRGFVTVGLVIGAGDLNGAPLCISDTVWYHNFFYFREMNAQFYLDPIYDQTTWTVSQGLCRERCKNESILFVYQDSTQDSLGLSYINWGDNTYTLDSFMYSEGRNDGYFVNGARRVRYEMWTGPCGEFTVPVVREIKEFPNGLPGVNVDTVWHQNYKHRIYHPVNNPTGSLDTLGRNQAGDSILINECGRQYWMALADTLKYWYYPEVQDVALMLMPVRHQYYTSSWEDGCKDNDVAPTPVFHILTSIKGCFATDVHGLVVRGVIDTAMTFNSDGKLDTIFCVGETVHFYDSVRYWRPDCSLSDPDFNKNRYWADPGQPELNAPYNGFHFDTTDYWRRQQDNSDIFTNDPENPYVEKMWWNFGDGDSAMGTRPKHAYKNPGRYVVMVRTRDRKGCLDTTWCVVYISDPVAKAEVKPGLFNCGDQATIYDKSFMTTGGNALVDSIKNNYWWFGERNTPDTITKFDAFNDDTANYYYRKNGYFRVKLVVETYQGCKDTGFAQVYISGPRPKIKVLSDTIGCAPHKVRIVNISDTDGQPVLTKAVQVLWGDAGNQKSKIITLQYDTVEFIYYDSGTFYIFADGDDNNPMQNNAGCRITRYPDTADNFEAPIRITVKRSYPAAIETNLQTVCVDQPFNIINKSDTVSYTEFKYMIYTADTVTQLDSFVRDNHSNVVTTSIDSMGQFLILLEPTKFAPGLPECKLYDTITINVVKPVADFDIDSITVAAPKFKFVNTSVGAVEYTWTAYNLSNPGTPYQGPVDKVQADKDWEIDFGKDTGDFVICVKAYTADPAKPICEDEYCDTLDYRFIVKMEIFNVFTPNADGKNDVFDIDIEGETDYDLVIFNRWGTKVFESKDSGKDWNGKNFNDGADCPAGTYYYVFKYALRSGKTETLNGSITLIRQQ